ncbi:PREDICTED: truncated transcription factor CAULIFLOWER D-like isoform X2 [Populus euphratica]|uniref:Truncated transcription factor CAULIFLOWER D-like isoform X2 n=1 Tax=Populus euphratica TaxID=75702 RepID=A0AAJ6XMC9_POPEU|nr:PREDICTED: truncated transcription factor CAULIFLOWER D-like isoform X2 [Populus euphratica]
MGRGKVELKRIENSASRQVTFSKRRNGLLKKAFELSILCEAEVSLIIFSPTGKFYQFSSHDMERSVARYRSEVGLPGTNDQRSRSMEFWRCEIEELRRTINKTEAQLRHFTGEDIAKLGLKELKQLERQLKTGVERIRSKKKRAISEHIKLLKSEQRALQEENARLQKRLHELPDDNVSSRIPEPNACNAFHQQR